MRMCAYSRTMQPSDKKTKSIISEINEWTNDSQTTVAKVQNTYIFNLKNMFSSSKEL